MPEKSPRGRPPKTTKRQWLDAAVELLGEEGVDAIRVEALARRLNVTKGGFYWHFEDRDALLVHLLEFWASAGTEAIIAAADAVGGDAVQRSEALWALASREGMGPELAIREWARRDPRASAAVDRVDRRRMSYLRALFGQLGFAGVDCESRCLLVYSLLVGNHLIRARHPKLTREQVLQHCRALLRHP